MPELPDLEVIREQLAPRLPGATILTAAVRRPLIVRNLLGGDPAASLVGRRFASVARRGKFLILGLDGDALSIVINPMLAGRLRYATPLKRDRTRDALVLTLDDGCELRYNDTEDMGKIYITHDLEQVPAFAGQGPEAIDPKLTLGVFRERLRHHQGEIKGVLTNQAFVAGIGNAYADEILWAARIYPFRRRADLSADEVAALNAAMRSVLADAIATLQARVGENIDVEIRDFLAVHGKPGQPCPRCGSPISEVKRERRATNFCRTCQPGLLVGPHRHLE
jgi:formamidopyrimidine-DNA glycosylase